MNFKTLTISAIMIFSTLIIGCFKNDFIDEKNINLLNYDFKIVDAGNIDKTLSNQRYSYSTNIDKKYVVVIIYKSKNASMKQYLINNNETIDLAILKDSNFIISLPVNRIIA